MTGTRVRWALAVIAVLVLGGAIFGIGQGGGGSGGSGGTDTSARDSGSGSGTSATTGTTAAPDQAATAKQRLAALGAVAGQGRDVFTGDSGCGGCHTLADAGTSGTIGPDLDDAISQQTVAQIRESIVDPEAQITKGYPSGLMPNNFGSDLSKTDLDALVEYLYAATHTG